MKINAEELHYTALNAAVRQSGEDIEIFGCVGQRYLGAGLAERKIVIHGTPGNALGAYLNGAELIVEGNVQEATGDTMNGGVIEVHGSAGDATGYAMRGGKIFIEGDVGYRCGIHMKAYLSHRPAIVIGGRAGSFLGEYQAGGTLIVLGGHKDGKPVVGNFCGTGMHGGEILLRCDALDAALPAQVKAERIEGPGSEQAISLVKEWCARFGKDETPYLEATYYRLTPNAENPYRQMYTPN